MAACLNQRPTHVVVQACPTDFQIGFTAMRLRGAVTKVVMSSCAR